MVFRRNGPLELPARGGPENTPDYKSIRDKTNRYLQDRDTTKAISFTGLGYNFSDQDRCVIEGAGFIQDRTKEMILSSDKVIVTARKLLLNAIKDIQAGREAPHVIRDPELNRFPQIAVINEVISTSADWREHTQKAESRVRVYGGTDQLQEGT